MTLHTLMDLVMDLFGVVNVPPLTPRYNIAPTQPILTVGLSSTGRGAGFMRWGLVPSWADDPKIGNRLINARGETVASKDAFRDAFRKRRCLIPADGFFEWVVEGKGKQPYLFQKADKTPFGFAGLWERWKPESGPDVLSCCVITTTANGTVSRFHDRMPVIFNGPDDFAAWLDPKATPEQLQQLLRPADDELLAATAVSKAVNNARYDGPDCIAAAE